ncbi:Speckle-type POZ protein [Araneus ventricosus]|uniref:Speckle-type POZ protein n=1 Tax=Araneus ventricosus TaxID=182803 RepID=A0A4Y2IFB3_ARAVE|nr:Speckle-type POZ protein [Araneus ventricosus]
MRNDFGFYTFTWTIRNFSFCQERKGYYLESPKFVLETCGETEWKLVLYPYGHDIEGYIACDLRLLSQISITATSTISIDGVDGFSHFSIERINQKFPNDAFSGIDSFVKRDEIFANKSFYLPKDTLTIRCEIRRWITEKPLIKLCSIRSEIGIKHISVPWDIKHFSGLQLNQVLKFPLSLNLKNEPHFEIHLYLDGNASDSSLRIDIKKESLKGFGQNYGSSIMIYCEASILDSKGIPCLSVEGMRFFDTSASDVVWKLPEIAKRVDLNTKKNLYLPDDVLLLRIQLDVSNGGMQSLPAEVHAVYPESRCVRPNSTMEHDFKLLYQEKNLCDIALKTASKTFEAHKAILACRSPVFKAMFEHDMVENSSGIVNISDVDPKTLEYMLFFMYANQLEDAVDTKSAIQLYCAADKYQINSLKECCYPILKSLVSAENVCEVLSLAYKYHDEPLKTIAKAFICKHPKETMDSGVWERLMEEKWSEPSQMDFFAGKVAPLNETESAFSISDDESYEKVVTMPKKKLKV